MSLLQRVKCLRFNPHYHSRQTPSENHCSKNGFPKSGKSAQLCKESWTRWSLQAATVTTVSSLFVFIDPLASLIDSYDYSACWIAVSSVVVLDSTTGASISRCLKRILGTILGGSLGWAAFLLVTLNESKLHYHYVPYLLWFAGVLLAIFWGLTRPLDPLTSTYGLITGVIIIYASYRNGDATRRALTRIASAIIGVIISGFTIHLVMPAPTRPRVRKGMARVLRSLADVFQPLLEHEIGFATVVSDQFRTNSVQQNPRCLSTLASEESCSPANQNSHCSPKTPGEIIGRPATRSTQCKTEEKEDEDDTPGHATSPSTSSSAAQRNTERSVNRMIEDYDVVAKRHVFARFIPSSSSHLSSSFRSRSLRRSQEDDGISREDLQDAMELWDKISGRLTDCSTSLIGLRDLISSAKREFSFKWDTWFSMPRLESFPTERYQEALDHLRRLFFLANAVYFTVDMHLQFMRDHQSPSCAWAQRKHLEIKVNSELPSHLASSERLVPESQTAEETVSQQEPKENKFSFFRHTTAKPRAMSETTKPPAMSETTKPRAMSETTNQHAMSQAPASQRRQTTTAPESDSQTTKHTSGKAGGSFSELLETPYSPTSGLPNAHWRSHISEDIDDYWKLTYGPLLARIAQHTQEALRSMAASLECHKSLFPAHAAIQSNAVAIEDYLDLRLQRRENFSTILQAAIGAERTGVWTKVGDNVWFSIVGRSIEGMSEQELEEFWECYWDKRDRLSVTCMRLLTFNGQLRRCYEIIDELCVLPQEPTSVLFI